MKFKMYPINMRIVFFLLFSQMNRLMKMLRIFVWGQAACTMLVCTEEEERWGWLCRKVFWCRSSKERSRIKKGKSKKARGENSPNILNKIARKCLLAPNSTEVKVSCTIKMSRNCWSLFQQDPCVCFRRRRSQLLSLPPIPASEAAEAEAPTMTKLSH